MKTDCSKCKKPMTELPLSKSAAPFNRMPMLITGYLCEHCKHWNNLKGRKGFDEYRATFYGFTKTSK